MKPVFVLRVLGSFLGLLLAAGMVEAAAAADLNVVKQDLSSGKAVLLDVREVDEWNDGHLRDARLLPLSRIEAGVKMQNFEAVAPPGKIVYLHCAAGARCQSAAQLLRRTGRDLRPLPQGYDELVEAGFAKAKE
ncbi:MAG: rhodanese-like domain-containing protein [Planctomycetales bacterium]|nr:rhodanese-like domain-containing protein [Planctomycetales bacterium]MBN8625431.1 rhodanese-like domain-containing protein [Planctomycetota bacterium]